MSPSTRMKILEGKNFCFIPFTLCLTSNTSWTNEQTTWILLHTRKKIHSRKQQQSLLLQVSILHFCCFSTVHTDRRTRTRWTGVKNTQLLALPSTRPAASPATAQSSAWGKSTQGRAGKSEGMSLNCPNKEHSPLPSSCFTSPSRSSRALSSSSPAFHVHVQAATPVPAAIVALQLLGRGRGKDLPLWSIMPNGTCFCPYP